MAKKMMWVVVLLCGLLLPARAQLQRASCIVHGVIPTENVTSLELNPSTDVIDDAGGISRDQVTFKGYYAYNKYVNFGVEVPLARFESPEKSIQGLGDISTSVTLTTFHNNRLSFGTNLELVVPTATDDLLGSGKVSFNPSAYAVYIPSENWFMALGYKQFWSIAGDGGRADTNKGRIRAILGYISNTKWWVLVDPQYYVNYETKGEAEFAPEAEIGTMINEGTAIYVRSGGHVGGNMKGRDWFASFGFKVLYL